MVIATNCENSKEVIKSCNGIAGTWISYDSDTLIIYKNCTGKIDVSVDDTTISWNCLIENELMLSSQEYDNWDSSSIYYDSSQRIITIYNFLQFDSIYFVDRPDWLNKIISEMLLEDTYYGASILRYKWHNEFIYHSKIPFLSCLYCNDYYDNGIKIIWDSNTIVDFEINKKNELLIWVNPTNILDFK